MKTWAVIGLLLASCSATSIADVVMPDEFTLGHADTTSALVGGYMGHNSMYEYDGESSTTAVALTWHLPPINEPMSRDERHSIREASLLIDEEAVVEEEQFAGSMATGSMFKADWRHATVFGAIMGVLLLILGFKLQRSNGWH